MSLALVSIGCLRARAADTPAQIYNSEASAQIHNNEDQAIESPAQIHNNGDQTIESPVLTYNSGDQTIESPAQIHNSRDQTIDTPAYTYNNEDHTFGDDFIFEGNNFESGHRIEGGILKASGTSSLVFGNNARFLGSTASSALGAIGGLFHLQDSASVTVGDSALFSDNHFSSEDEGIEGGVFHLQDSASITVGNNALFSDNQFSSEDGEIEGGIFSIKDSATITLGDGTTFEGNQMLGNSINGSVIRVASLVEHPLLLNGSTVFRNNTSGYIDSTSQRSSSPISMLGPMEVNLKISGQRILFEDNHAFKLSSTLGLSSSNESPISSTAGLLSSSADSPISSTIGPYSSDESPIDLETYRLASIFMEGSAAVLTLNLARGTSFELRDPLLTPAKDWKPHIVKNDDSGNFILWGRNDEFGGSVEIQGGQFYLLFDRDSKSKLDSLGNQVDPSGQREEALLMGSIVAFGAHSIYRPKVDYVVDATEHHRMAEILSVQMTVDEGARMIPQELSRLPPGVHVYTVDTSKFPGWEPNGLSSLTASSSTTIKIFGGGLVQKYGQTLGEFLERRRMMDLTMEERDLLDGLFAGEDLGLDSLKEYKYLCLEDQMDSVPDTMEENMRMFLSHLRSRGIELEDIEATRLYSQHNPDSHISSQMRANIISIQSSLDVLRDRMVSSSDDGDGAGNDDNNSIDDGASSSSSSQKIPRAHTLLAVAGPGVSIGVQKDEATKSNLWTRVFGSFGSQKFEENMKSTGFGIVLGVDSRVRDDFQLGLAYSFNSDSAKSDLRDRKTNINALSLYGDFDFRGFGTRKFGDREFYFRNLRLYVTLGYGFLSGEDNKLSGSGGLIHFSPTLSYEITLEKTEDRAMTLMPEFSLRYFRVHRDRQSTEYTEVDPLTGNVLTLVPAIRLGGLFRDRFEFSARLGLGYDVLSSGVNSYSITLPGGDNYRIEDESGDTRFMVEFGLNVGCRLNRVSRVALGYSGKYAEDLVNNNLSLGVGIRF